MAMPRYLPAIVHERSDPNRNTGNTFRNSQDSQNLELGISNQGPYGNLELFDTEAPLIDLESDDGYEDLYGLSPHPETAPSQSLLDFDGVFLGFSNFNSDTLRLQDYSASGTQELRETVDIPISTDNLLEDSLIISSYKGREGAIEINESIGKLTSDHTTNGTPWVKGKPTKNSEVQGIGLPIDRPLGLLRDSDKGFKKIGTSQDFLIDPLSTFAPEENRREVSPQIALAEAKTLHVPKLGKYHCPQCDVTCFDLFYCNLCRFSYCRSCWDKVGPHRVGIIGPGGIPHEKTDEDVAEKLRATFESAATDDEQISLHGMDQHTAWFGVAKDEQGDCIFYDYGRYAHIIAEVSRGRPKSRFPGLVSFVGETGAGKSSLIKVLIELSESVKSGHLTPIVGSIHNQDIPTSGDVHLYTDPKSFLSDTPIFYADCEGLNGGEREPKGARSKFLQHINSASRASKKGTTKSFERNRRNMDHSSEREVTWATTSETQTREFAVTNLYPRLLYTFSDAVVFVLKNPRIIENVIERLVDWAAAALEMSSNQPVLPHAIIVLNASDLNIDPRGWDVEYATQWLMDSVNESVSKNLSFKKYASTWSSRGKEVVSVEDLLLCYYTSVRVVRIPSLGRPNLIKNQMESLYQQIVSTCDSSRKSKRDLRMLLDADELQPYLQFAFDHFSNTLNLAFDFVQASFIYNPIPSDFAGNILKLAVNMMEIKQHVSDTEGIFMKLSYMVASCIMLDSARNKTRGGAELIFPEYVEHCDNALEDFCDRYFPCEFEFTSKTGKTRGRCINVRSGHSSKGHQLPSGKVFAGEYKSSFSLDTFQETFRNCVYYHLKVLLRKLRDTISKDQPEDQMAAQIHRADVMAEFYEYIADCKPEQLFSHAICFSCLMNLPEHSLPCGHILCTPCLQVYGTLVDKDVIDISSCPLHLDSSFKTWQVYLKPHTAGVRVLSLDGGGIRGIVELEILKQIEQIWGGKLRIHYFFDLIVGTSTGGLIALGLASKNWSVDECTWHFESLCNKAFTRRSGTDIPGLSLLVESYHHSRYETRPLHDALKQAFGENEYLFGGNRNSNTRLKVAVTTTVGGNASIITNYNRSHNEMLPYTFQRPDKLTAELKLWEAGRATSAAPRIFKPFSHEGSKNVYRDGAIYHNNPIQIADLERKLLWPSDSHNIPDFVLSIGTAYNPLSRNRPTGSSPTVGVGFFNDAKMLATIAIDHIKSTLDSEKTWHDYMQQLALPSRFRDRYQRINPPLLEEPPNMDDITSLKTLQQTVRIQMKGNSSIERAAYHLISTSFYFETTTSFESLQDGTLCCSGLIKCRLPREAMLDFGIFLRDSHNRSQGPYFVVREQGRPQGSQQILISKDIIACMLMKSQWRMDPIQMKVSSLVATTEIMLCVKKDEEFPISGFPRDLQSEDIRTNKRQVVDGKTERWRTRTPSQQRRRKKWTRPTQSDLPLLQTELLADKAKGVLGYPGSGYDLYNAGQGSPNSSDNSPRTPQCLADIAVPVEIEDTGIREMPG